MDDVLEVALFRPGSEPRAPRTKTIDLTVEGSSDANEIWMQIGDERVHLPPDGHWRGTTHGRGRIAISSADRFPDGLNGEVVDLEDGRPEARIVLRAYHVSE